MAIYYGNKEIGSIKQGGTSSLSWFSGSQVQNITNTSFRPIPTKNLLLQLDSTVITSYPGSGSVWTDMTGNGRNGIVTGSQVTWSNSVYTGSNGVFYVTGSGTSYISGSLVNVNYTPNEATNFWIQCPTASLPAGTPTLFDGNAKKLFYSGSEVYLGTATGNYLIPSASSIINDELTLVTITSFGPSDRPKVFINGWESMLLTASGSIAGASTGYKPFNAFNVTSSTSANVGYFAHISQYDRAFYADDALEYYLITYPRYFGKQATIPAVFG
jgi:hypothetical protein